MRWFTRPKQDEQVEQFASLMEALVDRHEPAPAAGDGLDELLRTSMAAHAALQAQPNRDARAEARRRLLTHAAAPRPARFAFLAGAPRLVTAGVAAAVLLMAGGFGAVKGAEAALPGDLLYPVKSGLEEAMLVLAQDEEARAELRLEFAMRRTDEIATLQNQGRSVPPAAVERMAEQTARVASAPGLAALPEPQAVLTLTARQEEVLLAVIAKAETKDSPAVDALRHALDMTKKGHSQAEAEVNERKGRRNEGGAGAAPTATSSATASPSATNTTSPTPAEDRGPGRGPQATPPGNRGGAPAQPTQAAPSPTQRPGERERDDSGRGAGGNPPQTPTSVPSPRGDDRGQPPRSQVIEPQPPSPAATARPDDDDRPRSTATPTRTPGANAQPAASATPRREDGDRATPTATPTADGDRSSNSDHSGGRSENTDDRSGGRSDNNDDRSGGRSDNNNDDRSGGRPGGDDRGPGPRGR